MELEGTYNRNKLKTYFDINQIKTASFQDFIQSLANVHKDKNCFKFFENEWQETSYRELADEVFKLARFFTHKDIQNKKIAILSESRPEMIKVMLSGFCANVCTTPIDTKLGANEIAYILNDIRPEIIFVSEQQLDSLKQTHSLLDFGPQIITITPIKDFYCLKDIPLNESIELPKEDTTKTGMIIYTSGSTGMMKGVETKSSQLLFQIHSLLRIGVAEKQERNLSMLPMNHLFEVSSLLSTLAAGQSICVAHSLEKEALGKCFQYQAPTQMFTVPLFTKSIITGIKLNIKDSAAAKRIVFGTLMFLAKLIPNSSFRRKLFTPIHEKFGGSLTRMIVGGAAVDTSIINFFKFIGIGIYEGYGLTETAPVIAVNRVDKHKPGAVGVLLPKVKVKIDETGEVLTKGPHLMRGYYKNPEATKDVFTDDGWFKTGDIGHLDRQGFLHITGRLKNVIILESGKNVHPEEVEKVFDDIDFIQEISIFGDKDKQSSNSRNIVLVAYLNPEFVQKHGKEEAQRILTEEVMKHSDKIAAYKMPTKILLSEKELPKTTTMKVKHFKVAQMYHNQEI